MNVYGRKTLETVLAGGRLPPVVEDALLRQLVTDIRLGLPPQCSVAK
jgi:hypothetical protein